MQDETPNWSPAYPLFDADAYLEVGSRPSVYRIRAFTKQGEPRPIPRLAGVDTMGILHIGKSKDLHRRIGYFRTAAAGAPAAHKAGREFSEWGFERLLPLANLCFDHVETATERDALNLERRLHEDYRNSFLDRPPLDGTSGQRG